MVRPTYTVERVNGAYELHVNGEFFGNYMSNAAADRFRKRVLAGPLDPQTMALVLQARAERAERLNRAAAKRIVDSAVDEPVAA